MVDFQKLQYYPDSTPGQCRLHRTKTIVNYDVWRRSNLSADFPLGNYRELKAATITPYEFQEVDVPSEEQTPLVDDTQAHASGRTDARADGSRRRKRKKLRAVPHEDRRGLGDPGDLGRKYKGTTRQT